MSWLTLNKIHTLSAQESVSIVKTGERGNYAVILWVYIRCGCLPLMTLEPFENKGAMQILGILMDS